MTTDDRPVLYMLIGLPGSGKSTWCNRIAVFPRMLYLSTDIYIETSAALQEKTYNEVFQDEIKNAEKELQSDLKAYTECKASFVWDQTNLTKKSRAKKLKQIPSFYRKIAVFFNTDYEKCLQVQKDRKDKNVPENVMQSMYDNLEEPSLDEGFDEMWLVAR